MGGITLLTTIADCFWEDITRNCIDNIKRVAVKIFRDFYRDSVGTSYCYISSLFMLGQR